MSTPSLDVTLSTVGRFHLFHLARQLERRDLLRGIWTGYPRRKLRDEKGIDPAKIHDLPALLVAQHLVFRSPGLRSWSWLRNELAWHHKLRIDRAVRDALRDPTILVGLSGSALWSGTRAQQRGGRYICDRGSSHISYQFDILKSEFARWGKPFGDEDPRVRDREEAEYAQADLITVPSQFVFDTFVERGIPAAKLRKIPYGGRLDRFSPVGQPDPEYFTLLFVGSLSLRKGLPYLLEAFAAFDHPRKRLRIVGPSDPSMDGVIERFPRENVEFLGLLPNDRLAQQYSDADLMVLPSIEEGLAMVMGEAMACGCPVLATTNTGASDLFTDGVEGRIVPPRSIEALRDAFTAFADDRPLLTEMRTRARARIASIGGWDDYGQRWADLIAEVNAGRAAT